MSTVISIVLSILSFLIKNFRVTSKNQKKVNNLVNANKHLLDEVTKLSIASELNKVNEKINTDISDVSAADSLQQSNSIINKTIGNRK